MFWKKKELESEEYLKLKKELAELKIDFKALAMDFDLVVKKLKVKYKISNRDKESEDINSSVLLPDDGKLQ
jgi:plasmid rolling circle replication initiator protein Rep